MQTKTKGEPPTVSAASELDFTSVLGAMQECMAAVRDGASSAARPIASVGDVRLVMVAVGPINKRREQLGGKL